MRAPSAVTSQADWLRSQGVDVVDLYGYEHATCPASVVDIASIDDLVRLKRLLGPRFKVVLAGHYWYGKKEKDYGHWTRKHLDFIRQTYGDPAMKPVEAKDRMGTDAVGGGDPAGRRAGRQVAPQQELQVVGLELVALRPPDAGAPVGDLHELQPVVAGRARRLAARPPHPAPRQVGRDVALEDAQQ